MYFQPYTLIIKTKKELFCISHYSIRGDYHACWIFIKALNTLNVVLLETLCFGNKGYPSNRQVV